MYRVQGTHSQVGYAEKRIKPCKGRGKLEPRLFLILNAFRTKIRVETNFLAWATPTGATPIRVTYGPWEFFENFYFGENMACGGI